MQETYPKYRHIAPEILRQKNAMKRNEKWQKMAKNKEYRKNQIVSAFVHHEEIIYNYLI